MTRSIDADALLKELRKSCEYHAENSREFSLLQRDIIIVQEQPTIDAVPVIRCKNCKFSILNNGVYVGSETHGTCIAMGATVDGDDYCSWAERRDEE